MRDAAGPEFTGPLAKLAHNDGERVEPDECRWIVRHLGGIDRAAIPTSEPEADELVGLMDAFERFCGQCAARGGFEVW